jgi:hypothetical protein
MINLRQESVTISTGVDSLNYTSTFAAIIATLRTQLVMELHITVLQVEGIVLIAELITRKEMEN